jgi:hypothetical protein
MVVGHTQINSEGIVEQVISNTYNTKQEAIEAANALALSLSSNSNALEVFRGYMISETDVKVRVTYEIPR